MLSATNATEPNVHMQLFMYWYESELTRRDSKLLCMEPNSDYVPQKNVVKKKKKKKNFTGFCSHNKNSPGLFCNYRICALSLSIFL